MRVVVLVMVVILMITLCAQKKHKFVGVYIVIQIPLSRMLDEQYRKL